jgi:hypothetical protein
VAQFVFKFSERYVENWGASMLSAYGRLSQKEKREWINLQACTPNSMLWHRQKSFVEQSFTTNRAGNLTRDIGDNQSR